jgi:DNA repair protein RAD7
LLPYFLARAILNIGIDAEKLEQIAYITPNLSTLQLSFCGRLIDETLATIVSHLKSLQHLILTGPFLVTVQTWKSALETIGPKLLTFEISDTARWNDDCSETLVSQCLSDTSVMCLSKLKNLKSLDLTEPSGTVTDKVMVTIIGSVGATLEKLVLDGCVTLGDETFQAIIAHCPNLKHLSLALLDQITDGCVAEGFNSWNRNKGLQILNFPRCVRIKDAGVQAMLTHSGTSLESLSLNSLDELTQDTFKLFNDSLTTVGDSLVELDVGFVRCVNDELVYMISRACKELRVIKVFSLPFQC